MTTISSSVAMPLRPIMPTRTPQQKHADEVSWRWTMFRATIGVGAGAGALTGVMVAKSARLEGLGVGALLGALVLGTFATARIALQYAGDSHGRGKQPV